MGLPVLLIGKSGSGKSASLRNFKDNIGVLNVNGKPLPFKGGEKLPGEVTDDYNRIKELLYKSSAASVVIDDAGYLITNAFMRGHSQTGKGNAVYALYNDLADQYWSLIQFVVKQLPEEKIVYFIMHEEKDESGDVKPKTIGKLLDDKVCVEGLFTIVLRSVFSDGKYKFKTQSDGFDIAKSPMGMLEPEIENDLKFVDDTIREYYNFGGKE
jgi:hypothetical protein